MKRALLIMLIVTAGAAEAQAGPWPAGTGRTAVSFTFVSLDTRRLATPAGDEIDIPAYDLRELTISGAWGIDDRFTVLASFPIQRYSAIEGFESARGPGDVRGGLQVQLGRVGQWVIAARGSVQIPTGDPELGGSLLPTGSGVWEGEALFSIGRTFEPGMAYLFAEVGHQMRGGGLRDGLGFTAEVGVIPTSRLRLGWAVRAVRPYNPEPGAGSLASPSGLGDGVQYVSTGPGISVTLGRGWSWNIDADGSFQARNLATGTRVRTGLTFSR